LNNLHKITQQLIKYGKPPETPVAVISKGTTADQKIAVGTLENIEQNLDGIVYPAIIVVGDTVKLRESLNWFEQKPLFGKKILVTRTKHQASVLSQKIEELGGEAMEFPTIEIVPNNNENELKEVFDRLNTYQWIIFTSVNGVEIFFKKLLHYGKDIREASQAKFCAIGEATKKAIEDKYLKVEFTPCEYVAEALIDGLKDKIKAGDKVLIPRTETARELLPVQLSKIGALVDVVSLYKTVMPNHTGEELKNILSEVDTITFTSSSAVENFVKILGKENLNLAKEKEIACIGPITYETAKSCGLKRCEIAKEYTINGLIDLLTEKKPCSTEAED